MSNFSFLIRNQEYIVKKANFNRFISYKSPGQYFDGTLRIEPFSDIKITVIAFPNSTDVEINVEKFDQNKKINITNGITTRIELINILGLD